MCIPVSTTYQPCHIILYQLKLPQSLVRKSIRQCIGIVQPGQDESPHCGQHKCHYPDSAESYWWPACDSRLNISHCWPVVTSASHSPISYAPRFRTLPTGATTASSTCSPKFELHYDFLQRCRGSGHELCLATVILQCILSHNCTSSDHNKFLLLLQWKMHHITFENPWKVWSSHSKHQQLLTVSTIHVLVTGQFYDYYQTSLLLSITGNILRLLSLQVSYHAGVKVKPPLFPHPWWRAEDTMGLLKGFHCRYTPGSGCFA